MKESEVRPVFRIMQMTEYNIQSRVYHPEFIEKRNYNLTYLINNGPKRLADLREVKILSMQMEETATATVGVVLHIDPGLQDTVVHELDIVEVDGHVAIVGGGADARGGGAFQQRLEVFNISPAAGNNFNPPIIMEYGV